MKRTIFRSFVALLILLFAYLLVWPVPIDPVAWTPPTAPELSGIYAQNSELSKIERLRISGNKPEDVAFDAQDRIYCGDDEGHIFRLQPDGTKPELFAETKGRPLGLAFDAAGNLIVADAIVGLLSIAPGAQVTVLSTEADGVPYRCPNDLDVAADGTIYFTDSSYKFRLTELRSDVLEHRPNGRLLAYDPRTRHTKVLLRDLYFANGVAVSPDQSFVLINDTGTYSVRRYWVRGDKAGQSDTFIDNLPGFPDGISSNGKGTFWVALNRRLPAVDWLLPHPFLRKIVFRLPLFLQPKPRNFAFVLGLDLNGKVVSNLQDSSPQCFAQCIQCIHLIGIPAFR